MPISPNPRPWSTAASATISSRSSSSAQAPNVLPAPLRRFSNRATRRPAGWREKAALLVREAPFPAVNQLAGDRGAAIETISRAHRQFARCRRSGAGISSTGRRKTARAAAAKSGDAEIGSRLFRRQRRPILHAKGKDGYACADCHATHTLFNATWSTIGNVVDTAHPGGQPGSPKADLDIRNRRHRRFVQTGTRRRPALGQGFTGIPDHPEMDRRREAVLRPEKRSSPIMIVCSSSSRCIIPSDSGASILSNCTSRSCSPR